MKACNHPCTHTHTVYSEKQFVLTNSCGLIFGLKHTFLRTEIDSGQVYTETGQIYLCSTFQQQMKTILFLPKTQKASRNDVEATKKVFRCILRVKRLENNDIFTRSNLLPFHKVEIINRSASCLLLLWQKNSLFQNIMQRQNYTQPPKSAHRRTFSLIMTHPRRQPSNQSS